MTVSLFPLSFNLLKPKYLTFTLRFTYTSSQSKKKLDSHCVFLFVSCLPHTDGMFGWHNSQVWDLGHCRTGTVSQLGTYVLQGSPGRHRGLRHHQHSELPGPWQDVSQASHKSFVICCDPFPPARVDDCLIQQTATDLCSFNCSSRMWHLKPEIQSLKDVFLFLFFFFSRIHSHVQRTGWRSSSDKPARILLLHWRGTKQTWPTRGLSISR